MSEPVSPVHVEVLTQLQAHGIVPEYITYPRVTLTSASRLCVRHSPPGESSRHCLTLLDPYASPKEDQAAPSWTLHQVQGALANPSRPLLAVRAASALVNGLGLGPRCSPAIVGDQIQDKLLHAGIRLEQQMLSLLLLNPLLEVLSHRDAGKLAQVYDVDQRSLRYQWTFDHPIEHWVWLNAGTLAVVTEVDVLHWTMKRTKPRRRFRRHERLWGMEIVGYRQDASRLWMALSALGLEQGQVMGLTQLYWRGGALSQVIEAQAVALPQHRFSRNQKPSAALLAAVRRGKEQTGQLHVVELGPHQPGNAALLSARGTLPFKGAQAGDFPSAVQFLRHLGVVVILTKHAFLFLADIETAQVIYLVQLACDILFATVLDEKKPHSLLGICRNGKVLSISVCPYALCQHLSRHPSSLYLSQRVLQLVGQIPAQWRAVPLE